MNQIYSQNRRFDQSRPTFGIENQSEYVMQELSKTQLPSHRYRWLACYIYSHLSQINLNQTIDWIQQSLDKGWIDMAKVLTELRLPMQNASRAFPQALNAQSWTLISYMTQQFTENERQLMHLPAIPILSVSIKRASTKKFLTKEKANAYIHSLIDMHKMGRIWIYRQRFLNLLQQGHDLFLEYLAKFIQMQDLSAVFVPFELLIMSHQQEVYVEMLEVYQEWISDLMALIPEMSRRYLQLYPYIQMTAFSQLPVDSQHSIVTLPFVSNDPFACLKLLPALLTVTEIPLKLRDYFKRTFLCDLHHLIKNVRSISWMSAFKAILRTWTITPTEFMSFFYLLREKSKDDHFIKVDFCVLMIELVLWDTQQGNQPMSQQGIQMLKEIQTMTHEVNLDVSYHFSINLRMSLRDSLFTEEILAQCDRCLSTRRTCQIL
jgi:hypothetical protein